PPRGRPARFWIGTGKGDAGKSSVTFVWEPIPPAPGERRPGEEGPSSVTLTALAADGRPLFRGTVPEQTSSPPPPGVQPAGVAASASFQAPPGKIQLRMSVQNASGQVMDSTTQEVTVPDFSTVEVGFGTPQFFRARTQRDLQQLIANPSPVPTAEH